MRRIVRSNSGWILANIRGTNVIFEEFLRADVACIQVWIKAGAAFEDESERGVAHFLEHLLFQSRLQRFGLRSLGDAVEGYGGAINAWTSQDFTVVHASCPVSVAKPILGLMLDYVLKPVFEPDAIETERRVILQEIAREEENPGLTCMRSLFEERYTGHPYGRRVLGTRESVSNLGPQDFARFHGRFYRPDNMVIAVVGRLRAEEVFEWSDEALSSFPTCSVPLVRPSIPMARPLKRRERIINRPTSEAYFCLGFPIPSLYHPHVPAIDCFSALLGEIKGAVLEKWRQETGLVNDIASFSYTPLHGGTLLVHGSTSPAKLEPALEGLSEVLMDAAYSTPSEADIALVREGVSAAALRLAETAQGLASNLGHEVASGARPGYSRRYIAKVAALTSRDVVSTVRRYVRPERMALVVLGPCENHLRVRWPSQVVKVAIERPRPGRSALEHGPVLLHWRDSTHGTVAIRIQAPGGLEFEDSASNGVHALLARLHLCGTKHRPGHEILKEFDALGAQVNFSAGYSVMAAVLDVPAGHVMAAVRLLAHCLAEPSLDEKDIRRESELLIEQIKSRVDRPQSLLLREIVSKLFAGDCYGLDPLGSPKVLSRLTSDDLRRALSVWDMRELTVAVVGDHDAEPVIAGLNEVLGGRSIGRPSRVDKPLVPKGLGHVEEVRGPFRQSHIGLAWPGPGIGAPDLLSARIAVAALSLMSGPLFEALRDNMGIAYSFSATLTALTRGGFVTITAAVRPGTEREAVEAVRREVGRLLEGGSDAAALLERAKRVLASAEIVQLQRKSAVAHWMCTYDGTPLGYDSFLDIGERIDSISVQESLESARRIFCFEPLTVLLRPEAE